MHRQRRPRRAYSQFRLNPQLVCLDVFFKFARENLSLFGIEALHVGSQRQQGGEDHEGDDDGYEHRTLLKVGRTCPGDLNTEGTEDTEAGE